MTDADQIVKAGGGGKSLKEQNRWLLWVILAANSVFLYGVVQANAIRFGGLHALLTDSGSLLPVGLALVVSTVLSGALSNDNKDRLVFLRWRYALPGHRAFSMHAHADPRIDVEALKRAHASEFPIELADQNRLWYKMYLTVQDRPAVYQVHRSFLLLRDYTGMSALFLLFYGSAGFYTIPSEKVAYLYFVVLALQFLIVRHSASNYGVSFVKTVLAQKSASPGSAGTKSRGTKESGIK